MNHHFKATYGTLRADAVNFVDSLDMNVFACFDDSDPERVLKAIGRELIDGKGNRRAAVVTLLKRIAERDAVFFGSIAMLFNKQDSGLAAADPLRAQLAELRFMQECTLMPPMTLNEISDYIHKHLDQSFDETTVRKAARGVGVVIRADKKGRPKKRKDVTK